MRTVAFVARTTTADVPDAKASIARVDRAQRRLQRVAAPIARKLWDVETVGFDRLPAAGGAILCPNHVSFLDSAFLMLATDRTITFLGKSEYLDSWKTRHLFPAVGMIPIDRSGGANSIGALRTALDVLDEGALLGIFPEGTRSRTGHLHKGRTGAARLALSAEVPVFPVGITGTADIQPPDAKLPSLGGSCRIEIGEPIDPRRFLDMPGPAAARSLTDEVMYEVRELTGQQYRDHYAGKTPREGTDQAVPVPRNRRASSGPGRERRDERVLVSA